jgi:hypothetical protein
MQLIDDSEIPNGSNFNIIYEKGQHTQRGDSWWKNHKTLIPCTILIKKPRGCKEGVRRV